MERATLAVVACGFFSGAAAQGLFQFDSIPGIGSEPHVQIDLGPTMLGFAAEAARQSDPRAADMIAGLRGISVRVYDSISDASAVQSFVDRTSLSLEQGGWERVVFVQDGMDKVRVHALVENNQMVGMTFMVLDSSDAVFINIDGQIDPVQLGRVAAAMGLGDMLGAFFGAAQSAPQSAPRGPGPGPRPPGAGQ
jgi:hypothetical protein